MIGKAILFLDQIPATMTEVNNSDLQTNTKTVRNWLHSPDIKNYLWNHLLFRSPYFGAIMVINNPGAVFAVFTKAVYENEKWDFKCNEFKNLRHSCDGMVFRNFDFAPKFSEDGEAYVAGFDALRNRNQDLITHAQDVLDGRTELRPVIADRATFVTTTPKIEVPTTLSGGGPLTLKVGDRVVRGPDWQYGEQDGKVDSCGRPRFGTVMKAAVREWVEVKWDNGGFNHYRFGDFGKEKFYKEIVLA